MREVRVPVFAIVGLISSHLLLIVELVLIGVYRMLDGVITGGNRTDRRNHGVAGPNTGRRI